MNRVTRALGVLVRSLRLRGEEGWVAHRPVMALAALLMGLVGFGVAADKTKDDEAIDKSAAVTTATGSRSTTIALTSDEQRVVVVNREANSLSIIRVTRARPGCRHQACRNRRWRRASLRGYPPERPGGVRHQRHQRHRLGR